MPKKTILNPQKILFVIPKLKNMFGGKGGVPGHPHVGIASLTSFLLTKGFPKSHLAIYDEGVEKDVVGLKQLIHKFQPDIIGITTFSYCYVSVLDTIRRVSRITKTPIIIGGPHVSAVKSQVLEENPKVTFAIKGEGEHTFFVLLTALREKQTDLSGIPGLIWRKGKKVIENMDRPFLKDVNSLPFPKYECFNLPSYPCFDSKSLPILTSRGCPYGCNYCSVKLSMGRGFRPRSSQNVIKEIGYWYKRGFTSFSINDDCFTLDLDRAEKICNLIIKAKMKIKINLYNGIRVDRITPKLLRKLKKAGCVFIAYGCEAGNQETINTINKNIKLEQVVKAVNWTNKVGIKNAVNFIVGHENETFERAMDSVKFAETLKCGFVNFYNLVPYPGTKVYEWAIKNAHFLYPKETFLKNISYRDNTPIFETKEFTKVQRETVMKKGFNLYEKKLLQLRLGKIAGTIGYLVTRPKPLHDMSIKIISSRLGWRMYSRLSHQD